MPPVLFAAGDPGGANAVRPVALELAARGHSVSVLDHGTLPLILPSCITVHPRSEDWGGSVCIGTSLSDTVPLGLARRVANSGGLVVAVLDNWMNYRTRLTMDGGPLLVPSHYAVMDERARDEAIADGVPATCLRITGHPNLASLAEALKSTSPMRERVRQATGLGQGGRDLVVFVNEPVERDQGASPKCPGWRGYTERTALSDLAFWLPILDSQADLAIVPHPRDDAAALARMWEHIRGHCPGRVVTDCAGRDLIIAADRVVGMASILLYEAWLLGLPVFSLQPGLVRDDLLSVATRPGVKLARRLDEVSSVMAQWLALERGGARPELAVHAAAPSSVADLLIP